MGEVERIFFKALHTLALKHSGGGTPLEQYIAVRERDAELMNIMVDSISYEPFMGEYTIKLRDAMVMKSPFRHTQPPRRPHADYESTAEEIIEIDEGRKELPSG